MAGHSQFNRIMPPGPGQPSLDEWPLTSHRAVMIPMKSYTATITVTEVTPSGRISKQLRLDKPLPLPPKFEMDHSRESRTSADPATAEFEGNVDVTDAIPSKTALEKAASLPVLDVEGKKVPFRWLYEGEEGEKKNLRVIVIFIRHFFCGNCQEYLRTLVAAFPSPEEMLSLPTPTSIAIVGCGSPTLIPMYKDLTSCPYPIYADPTKRLFSLLGMSRTLSLGRTDPDYIQHTLVAGMVKSIVQGLGRMGKGDVTKAGDMRQVGGEFVIEKGRVTWCHRMRNTRDHTEVPALQKILGITSDKPSRTRQQQQQPSPLKRRWTTSLARLGSMRRPTWAERKPSLHVHSRRRKHSQSRSRSRSRSPSLRRAVQDSGSPPFLHRRAQTQTTVDYHNTITIPEEHTNGPSEGPQEQKEQQKQHQQQQHFDEEQEQEQNPLQNIILVDEEKDMTNEPHAL